MSFDQMQPAASSARSVSPGQAMVLPGAFIGALIALGWQVRSSAVVSASIVGAGVFLSAWAAVLYATAKRSGRTFGWSSPYSSTTGCRRARRW